MSASASGRVKPRTASVRVARSNPIDHTQGVTHRLRRSLTVSYLTPASAPPAFPRHRTTSPAGPTFRQTPFACASPAVVHTDADRRTRDEAVVRGRRRARTCDYHPVSYDNPRRPMRVCMAGLQRGLACLENLPVGALPSRPPRRFSAHPVRPYRWPRPRPRPRPRPKPRRRPRPQPRRLGARHGQLRIVDLGALEGDCCSSAAAINERGQVVGESNDQAFLWHRGHMIGLGDLGGNYSFAQDVNDRGSVVG